jgi:hypothetical protein
MTLPHARDDAEPFAPHTAESAAAYDRALTKVRSVLRGNAYTAPNASHA